MKKLEKILIVGSFWGLILITASGLMNITCIRTIGGQFIRVLKAPMQYTSTINSAISSVESMIDNNLAFKYPYINLYGEIQKLMQREIVKIGSDTVVQLPNQHFAFDYGAIADDQVSESTERIAELSQYCNAQGIPFAYYLAPYKVQPDEENLPQEFTDFINPAGNAFLAKLTQLEVPHVDLRERMMNTEKWYDYFFRTDHHWKPEAGLWAARVICRGLAAEGIISDDGALEEAAFSKTVFPETFLGSIGKKWENFGRNLMILR